MDNRQLSHTSVSPRTGIACNWLVLAGFCLFVSSYWSRATADENSKPAAALKSDRPAEHVTKQIEGWTVQIDGRLLKEPHIELGNKAVRLLGDRLYELTLLLDPAKIEKLREFPIWLDLNHGELRSMQYHPNPGWLLSHGYSAELALGVHIPDAAGFTNPHHLHTQPWAIFHELAHAYHHRVLQYGEPRILAAYERFSAQPQYESVLHVSGRQREHYARTNDKEFFAEMSEAYVGLNDFYPFHRGELQRDEPEIFALMKEIWGPLP